MVPRQQAGHMLAIDPPVIILFEALASEGPSTHTLSRIGDLPAAAIARVKRIPKSSGVREPIHKSGIIGRYFDTSRSAASSQRGLAPAPTNSATGCFLRTASELTCDRLAYR
jgi:hypothetical protein